MQTAHAMTALIIRFLLRRLRAALETGLFPPYPGCCPFDWGLRPLFAGDKTPPSMYNISYYKNPTVDADIMKALGTTDRAEKTKLYTEVQEEIWKDAPWAFLVTEKLLYATSKKLTGMYVMPDANYFFEEIDLQ